METKQKLGSEPAFPCQIKIMTGTERIIVKDEITGEGETHDIHHYEIAEMTGISKRLWLAGMAMQGLTANSHEDLIKMDFETLSKQAFRIADWMLNQEEQQ
jgi:hypothetical protein